MLQEPWFWRERGFVAGAVSAALTPAAFLYAGAQKLRHRTTKPYRAKVPVICIGNATLGGVGKTPFAIALANILKDAGWSPHFLTRGYGGSLSGPIAVDAANHLSDEVGDEALLLAKTGPVWLARRRPDGARMAQNAGADCIIMDDGYQNPTLFKDISILLTAENDPFGNGKVFPAGPLREAPEDAAARADISVFIASTPGTEQGRSGAYRAWLSVKSGPDKDTKPMFAFCGIGAPQRFFETLAREGYEIAGTMAFADHAPYSIETIERMLAQATRLGAQAITTEKDMMRIPQSAREKIEILKVSMQITPQGAFVDDILNQLESARQSASETQ